MREQFCVNGCTTNIGSRLASAPCFVCPGIDDGLPVPVPGTPVFGTPPEAAALDPANPAYIIAGTGVPAEYAAVVGDNIVQLFLIPLIAGTDNIGPPVGNDYAVGLTVGQEISVAFGVTWLAAASPITDLYDIQLSATHVQSGTIATLDLTRNLSAVSGYSWNNGSYIVTDSETNAAGTTVQNITRPRFLEDITLDPTASDIPSTTTWTLTATHVESGETTSVTVNVIATAA